MKTPVTRRLFLAGTAAAVLPAADRKPSLLFLTETDAARMRDALMAERRAPIETQAAAALKASPWSVTYHCPEGKRVRLSDSVPARPQEVDEGSDPCTQPERILFSRPGRHGPALSKTAVRLSPTAARPSGVRAVSGYAGPPIGFS